MSSEGGHYNRTEDEVYMNLANPDWMKTFTEFGTDDLIEAFIETLAEEYTHMGIDPDIKDAFEEFLEENKGKFTPEEAVKYGHAMHEIGANIGRGYSPLGAWLMVTGHANVPEDVRRWIVDTKLSDAIPEDLEKNVLDTYSKLRQIYDSNENSRGLNLGLETIVDGFKQLYGGGIRDALA